jgi:pterin-4a-carbinolamine dehydratase
MAGDWIKMTSNLDAKPEVFKIAILLNMHNLDVVGRLYKLWSWADQHTISGNAVSVTDVTLEKIVDTPGFSEALRKVGWLEGRDNHLSFPNFERHNGQTAKNRALTKDRVAKGRHAFGNDNVTQRALPEKRREEVLTTKAQGRDFELAAMSPEAALADLQRHHPDIDIPNEVKRFKQYVADKGSKPTWKGLLGWLAKASPTMNIKRGDLPSKVIPIAKGQSPIPEHEQKQMAQELAEMRRSAGV